MSAMEGTLIKILFLFLPFTGSAQMFGSLAADDYDAYQLISIASITETSHRDGLNLITKDTKAYGFWNGFNALYPYVGSTNSQHKWNLKDLRDLDAAYRLTFVNSPTSSTNGVDFNGSTQYLNTHFSTFASLDSRHVSAYLRDNAAVTGCDIGNTGAAANDGIGLYARWSGDQIFWNTDNASFESSSTSESRGFWAVSRTASNARALYQNGSPLQTVTTASSASTAKDIYIGVDNALANYSSRQTAFNSIGAGYTAAQMITFNTIVERFQDRLGRGVQ